jgi:SAM-dependent methyltransferase
MPQPLHVGHEATKELTPGDFTGLAEDYARYRPGYAPDAVKALTGLLSARPGALDAADVGAGTGIFTRMLAAQGFRSVTAVEPNTDMRQTGMHVNAGHNITWREGRGEATGLAAESVDLVTMASSFHWVDAGKGLTEFHRILRKDGLFAALWNPRHIEDNPLLLDIETKAAVLAGDTTRRSSGLSGRAAEMTQLLTDSPLFGMPLYLEGRHRMNFTPEAYLGVWRSVNDWQVKLGPSRFKLFLDYVADRVRDLDKIEVTYLTRAWIVRKQ